MKKFRATKEQLAELPSYNKKWIENAINCEPIAPHYEEIKTNVIEMYRLAGLPPPKNIVFVPSPFVLAFAGSFAAAIWHMRKTGFLSIKDAAKFAPYRKLCELSDPRIMHPDFCMISDRPRFIKMDDKNRPHCDNGPYCQWRDGWSLYYMHGVKMEAWMVETHPSKLDPKKVLNIENVDQRREVIRRMGVERLPHKVIDAMKYETRTRVAINAPEDCDEKREKYPNLVLEYETIVIKHDYELWEVDLTPDLKGCKYLKMTNPSIDVFHVEGVSNDCKTVEHAINWRAFKDIHREWKPCQLT